MLNFRCLAICGALCLAIAGSAAANPTDSNKRVSLAALAGGSSFMGAAAAQPEPTTVNPLTYISLHGGAMLAPRVGGLVGADASIPSLSIGNGWHGRIDADVIFKANFGGVDTIVPVTFDQLYYSPNAAGGHNVYYGIGLGAVLSGPARFDGKLILGTELTKNLGAEANLHITERDTLFTLLARLHL